MSSSIITYANCALPVPFSEGITWHELQILVLPFVLFHYDCCLGHLSEMFGAFRVIFKVFSVGVGTSDFVVVLFLFLIHKQMTLDREKDLN